MRRMIRNIKTTEYLAASGWSGDEALAREFVSVKEAIEACVSLRLKDVELVFRTGEDHEEFSLRIPNSILDPHVWPHG